MVQSDTAENGSCGNLGFGADLFKNADKLSNGSVLQCHTECASYGLAYIQNQPYGKPKQAKPG